MSKKEVRLCQICHVVPVRKKYCVNCRGYAKEEYYYNVTRVKRNKERKEKLERQK